MAQRRQPLFTINKGNGGIEYRRRYQIKAGPRAHGRRRRNPDGPKDFRIVSPGELVWEAMMRAENH